MKLFLSREQTFFITIKNAKHKLFNNINPYLRKNIPTLCTTKSNLHRHLQTPRMCKNGRFHRILSHIFRKTNHTRPSNRQGGTKNKNPTDDVFSSSITDRFLWAKRRTFSPDNRADANRIFPWSTVATRNKDNSRVFPLAIITIYVPLQDNSGKKIPSTQGRCLNLRFYLTSIRRTISDN